MQRSRALLGCWLLTSSTFGCGGNAQTVSARLGPSAWDIRVVATPTPVDGQTPSDTTDASQTFAFTLALIGDPSNLSGILSTSGVATEFPLVQLSESSAGLDEAKQIAVPIGSPLISDLTFHTLTIRGDGDKLSGQGEGSVGHNCGDCSYDVNADFTLAGQPDSTAPQLAIPTVPLNPLDPVSLSVSEALQTGTLELSGSSTISLSLSTENSSDRPMQFTTRQVLPFDGAWHVMGSARDFAGHAIDLSAAQLTTPADPGIFTQDGFESSPVSALLDGATVVGSSRGLPIPKGDHALLLLPGDSATFHLLRTAAQTKVTATVVELKQKDGGTPYGDFDVATVGGTQRETLMWGSVDAFTATDDPMWQAGPAAQASAALADVGSDVVVRLSPRANCQALCPAPGALLIDDLKLE